MIDVLLVALLVLILLLAGVLVTLGVMVIVHAVGLVDWDELQARGKFHRALRKLSREGDGHAS